MKPYRLLAFALFATPTLVAADGAVVFNRNCAACHQSNGKGLPGTFPSLAGNPFVTGDETAVVRTVLNGRNAMPGFRDALPDTALAEALSYIRSSWGNRASAVEPAMVAKERASK